MALDLDVRRLHRLATERANMEVREGDVLSVPLGERVYDFVHARLVFGHLGKRERALERLVAVVQSGGWVLLEDADFLRFSDSVRH